MILQLIDNQGSYNSLDTFEDFEIKYNHQYFDYNTVGGKRIPYTKKFKIPLNDRNRGICGIPFDATYPLKYSINGRALYTDNSVAFYFTADIEKQVINVLEPYIEISIIDKISKALKDMSKFKMSDLTLGDEFTLLDEAVFDTPDELGVDDYFMLPFYNFNNKASTFAFDPMRGLNQLQPTFIVGKLVQKMFTYLGLGTLNSEVLLSDNSLYTGVKANQLGLMLPSDLKTKSNYTFTRPQYFAGSVSGSSTATICDAVNPRVNGVPSTFITSPRISLGNIWESVGKNEHCKLNVDWKMFGQTTTESKYGARMASTVDGLMKVEVTNNNVSNKTRIQFGWLTHMVNVGVNTFPSFTQVTSADAAPSTLDVKVVDCNFRPNNEFNYFGGANRYELSNTYDAAIGQKIGTATYVGIVGDRLTYEIDYEDSILEFDVKANQDLEYGLILSPTEGDYDYTHRFETTSYDIGGTQVWDLIIRDGFIEYKLISSTNTSAGDYYESRERWLCYEGADTYPTDWRISFEEATSVPSGSFRGNGSGSDELVALNPTVIDMSETMKSIKDYTLLEVVKMIMERFNLNLYSDSVGNIHIDSYENMLSGDLLFIDYLIDEGIDVNFDDNDKGVISIKDTNPSFYLDNFNELDKYEVSEDKREEYTLTFKSSIVANKMFEDTYNADGFDLLKWVNDSNFWGTSDRIQVQSSDLKPVFSILEPAVNQIFLPINDCTYSEPLPDSNDPDNEYNVGFYNHFERFDKGSGDLLVQKTKAVNIHSTSGFKLISFKDNDFVLDDDNLYKQTWYNRLMDIMNPESVSISLDIYCSEETVKTLIDFPTIMWKGQEWNIQGFNNYPLSAQDGGLVTIKLIQKKNWLGDSLGIVNNVVFDVIFLPSITLDKDIAMGWDAPASDFDIDHYEIWKLEPDDTEWVLLTDSVTITSYVHTPSFYTPSSDYCYKIKAVDINNNKSADFSNTMCIQFPI